MVVVQESPTPSRAWAPRPAAGAVRRVLVLVPPAAGPDVALAQRAWQLAAPARLPVVLVGLAQEAASAAQRRRQLASLAALTRDDGVPVTVHLAHQPGWGPAVRALWQPGDLVLCISGQLAPPGRRGFGRRPLAQVLRAAMAGPLGALAVVAGFFALQAWVVARAHGAAESLLLLISVVAEFYLIQHIGHWPPAGR